jgi:hypothetical protein
MEERISLRKSAASLPHSQTEGMYSAPSSPGQPTRDFAYWRDFACSFLGAVSVLACLGHGLEWWEGHKLIDWNIALGSFCAFLVLALFSPSKTTYLFNTLVTIVAWGVLGAIAGQTLRGLPLILPCAALAYLLVKSKSHLIR